MNPDSPPSTSRLPSQAPHSRSVSNTSKPTFSSQHTPLAVILAPGKAQALQPTTQLGDVQPSRLKLRREGERRSEISCRSTLNRIISAQTSSPTLKATSNLATSPPIHQVNSLTFVPLRSTQHTNSESRFDSPQPVTDSPLQDLNPIPVDAIEEPIDQPLSQTDMVQGTGWLSGWQSVSSQPPNQPDNQLGSREDTVKPSTPSSLSEPKEPDTSGPSQGSALTTIPDASQEKSAVPQSRSSARPSSWFGFSRQPLDQSASQAHEPTCPAGSSTTETGDNPGQLLPAVPAIPFGSTPGGQDVVNDAYPPAPMTRPQQRRTSRWYPRILASDTTISTSTKETHSVQADKPPTDFNSIANTSKQEMSTTRSGSPDGPSCSAPDEPAPVVGVEPASGSDRALSTASDTQSSWWGWGRLVNLETRASASSTPSAHESMDASLVDVSSLQNQDIQTTPNLNDSNPQTYAARVGSWVYSWYDNGVPVSSLPPNDSAPNSSQPSSFDAIEGPPAESESGSTNQLSDLMPNPISESIPTNSRGWAGMFSTRRVIPARDVDEERKSVETMEIELTSSSPEDLGPSAGPSTIRVPQPPSTTSFLSRIPSLKRKGPVGSTSANIPEVDAKRITANGAEDFNHTVKETPPRLSFTSRYWGGSGSSTQAQQPTRKSEPEGQSEPPKAKIHRPLTDSSLPLSGISIVNGKARATIPNLVLPSFEDTFMHPPRSFAPKSATNNKLKQTIDLVQAYIFSSPPTTPGVELEDLHTRERQIRELFHRNSHISVRLPKPLEVLGVDKKERLKALGKVVVIGIHGWFPGPWLETVIGKPTGTSAKFADMMGSSLQEYVEGHLGGSLNQEFLTLIALEGDGTVDKRVDRLYKELYKRQDWVHSIHAADAIFVVAHSQGSIVSCKLLERLIKMDGVSGEKVMLLCMCGIWNGPFMGLNSSYALQPVLKLLEGPAAHELFEFQDPRSRASQSVLASLNFCLSTGIKMLLVASLNDQVVPLYSALYNSISHPSILRAVFIDSAVFYSTDFLTNLITFCQRLRNAGLSDHGLQNHLSEAVIGSLSGVGHSTVYEDRDVFDLAVRYFFETSSPLESPTWVEEPARKGRARRKRLPLSLTQVDSSFFPKERQNPFLLPWALRGLMDDRLVQMLFGKELKRLRAEFDDWKPVTKVLKELKMRLEPLKLDSTTVEQNLMEVTSIGFEEEEEET